MSLSRKIRDSIAKYDNSDCTEVLFKQDNCPPRCPPYEKTNCSDTCVVEECCSSPKYCQDPCGDKYCERVISDCTMRSPTGSLHQMRYPITNCRPRRSCPCPSPSPCCHNPYRARMKMRCAPPDCRSPKYSRYIDPHIDRCCDPCDARLPRACDSTTVIKDRMPRTRVDRRCSPRRPPKMCGSPCGNPRCKKPPCNYRYHRNFVKPKMCFDDCSPRMSPCTSPKRSCSPPCASPCCEPCKPSRCASPCRPKKYCPKPSPCPPPVDPCGPCLPRRPPYCEPRTRCPPNCDSFKYPCFYYDKSCNNLCVKMVDGCTLPSENNCCKPLTSLFYSDSGTMFSISPCDRDKCRGDYNYRINKLRSLSNIRSEIFNDCNDKCGPGRRCPVPCPPDGGPCPPCPSSERPCSPCPPGGGACPPYKPGRSSVCYPRGGTYGSCTPSDGICDPCRPDGGAYGSSPCSPCPPRSRPCPRNLNCLGCDSCRPCRSRRPYTRSKSLCFNDCKYGLTRSYNTNCGRPKTCPTPVISDCNTSCKCSGCTMFGPSYCVQRSNCRVPCLCAKYSCLPKFC